MIVSAPVLIRMVWAGPDRRSPPASTATVCGSRKVAPAGEDRRGFGVVQRLVVAAAEQRGEGLDLLDRACVPFRRRVVCSRRFSAWWTRALVGTQPTLGQVPPYIRSRLLDEHHALAEAAHLLGDGLAALAEADDEKIGVKGVVGGVHASSLDM